ncbi:MAG: hypothetical protein GY710_00790 [Desulfobacteraceae bacterium]|nr:hypothetical protein [Desulfobacteraceae bacterium]
MIDNYGNLTNMEYDSLGRKTSMDDPDMGHWSYTYDGNDNLLTRTDAKNQTITFKYDSLNRVISKTYSTSDPAIFYTYDNLDISNGRGLLYNTDNGRVTTTINGYDTGQNVLSETKTIIGAPKTYTTSSTYDLVGRPVTTTYPQGLSVTNIYIPGTSLLGEVKGSDGISYAKIGDYTPGGKIGRIDYPNHTYTKYAYDDLSQHLVSINTNGTGATPPVLENSYSYTPAGDIAGINDNLNKINYSYTYDKLHRLTGENNTGNTPGLSYAYNAIGNIISKTHGPNTLNYNYASNAPPHAVSSIKMGESSYTYSYDANGNLLSGPDFTNPLQTGTRTITYNADNMPQGIDHTTNSTSVSFTYDGDLQRAKKSVTNGATTFYVNKYFQVTNENNTIEPTNYIFAGDLRIAQIKGSTNYYFHKDHLGSSTLMSDASGNKVETTQYLPYGGERSHTGTKVTDYKFTDQEKDDSTELYNYGARLYDPVVGVFISPDTALPNFSDLENGRVYDPQSFNRYAYCRNNPLIYTDPSGHFFETGWDIYNVSMGVASLGKNVYSGNYWGAAADFVGLLIDSTAAVIPGVPAGFGTGLKALRTVNTVIDVVDIANANWAEKEKEPEKTPKKGTYSRPSGYRKGVKDKAWNDAVEPSTGRVRDPKTGQFMSKNKSWDMGHKPGYEFRKHQNNAEERGINRRQFLDEHNKSSHYRPELPSSNRSHAAEDMTNRYFGP